MWRLKPSERQVNLDLVRIKFGFIGIYLIFAPCMVSAQQQVAIQVEGVIKPHCAFAQSGNGTVTGRSDVAFNINPEEANWSKQAAKIPLAMSCNAPFSLAVRSSLGGLKNTTSANKAIGGSFSNEISYQIALNMTTEDAASPLVLACQSLDLADNDRLCSASSGTNAAIGRGAGIGELAITLSDSSGFPIRGHYQDTIVVALAFQ
jgi:hypothetical protein